MEEMLEAMIRDNGLRAMSVTASSAPGPFQFDVYAHWGHPDEGTCAGGSGPTVADALAMAVEEMRTRRTALASVEPHTEGVAP